MAETIDPTEVRTAAIFGAIRADILRAAGIEIDPVDDIDSHIDITGGDIEQLMQLTVKATLNVSGANPRKPL